MLIPTSWRHDILLLVCLNRSVCDLLIATIDISNSIGSPNTTMASTPLLLSMGFLNALWYQWGCGSGRPDHVVWQKALVAMRR